MANVRLLLAAVLLLVALRDARAADYPPCADGAMTQDFSAFVHSRILAVRAREAEVVKARTQQKNNTNQTQMPTVAGNSPSLVDESSASDLVGVALNLLGVSTRSTEDTSTAATVSAFALRAALDGADPLDPEYYNANAGWRRASFTLGVDFPQDGGNREAERGVIVGTKVLLYNERDIAGDVEFEGRVNELLAEVGGGVVRAVEGRMMNLLRPAMCQTATGEFVDSGKVDASQLREIDSIMATEARAAIDYQKNAAALAREVNERPQIAVEFLTNQRQGEATSTYKGALTADLGWSVDLGFVDSLALTFNGGYVYDDQAAPSADGQGGTVGAKLRFFRSPEMLRDRVPWTLSLATDGAWKSNETPQYRVQAAFSFALWEGVELPLTVAWANQTELVKEDQVIGNIGFTLDTAKLLAHMR